MAGARGGTKVSVCIKPREPGGYRLSVRDCRRGVCYAGCAVRGYVPCLTSRDSNSAQTLLSASVGPLSLVALPLEPAAPRFSTSVRTWHTVFAGFDRSSVDSNPIPLLRVSMTLGISRESSYLVDFYELVNKFVDASRTKRDILEAVRTAISIFER